MEKSNSYYCFISYQFKLKCLLCMQFVISSCGVESRSTGSDQDKFEEGDLISEAYWDRAESVLRVSGKISAEEQWVELQDGSKGNRLDRTNVNRQGHWSLVMDNVKPVPCAVTAKTTRFKETQSVVNAPSGCGTRGLSARAQIAPEGHILMPQGDLVINAGDRVQFQGHAFDPDQTTPLNFDWDFAGAANRSNVENPGDIQFNDAGEFRVRLQVRDNQGLFDPTPPERMIRVIDNSNLAPYSRILEPASDMVVNVGDVIRFTGDGVDPDGNNPLDFYWEFGQMANGNVRDPGEVIFNQEGNYLVRMQVIDNLGLADPNPDERMITVMAAIGQTNQAPESIILEPAQDRIVNVGDRIFFRGDGNDADGDNPLVFDWNFDGGAGNVMQRDPGEIRFDRAGVFNIRMRAMDNRGERDRTPAMRRIEVRGQTLGNRAPDSLIVYPGNDRMIRVGDRIRFRGRGMDPDDNDRLEFEWDFDGGADNEYARDPGEIQFDREGRFRVRFRAMDNAGFFDESPDERIIDVIGRQGLNQSPDSHILEPLGDRVINVGDRLRFRGHGMDPEDDTPFQFAWDFDGAVADDFMQDPGNIVFDRPGTYRIRMMVRDAQGRQDSTPDERRITVMGNNNFSPNARIIEPANDIIIREGDVVRFEGRGDDRDQDMPLAFRWDFDGAQANSDKENPGEIQFDKAGSYRIRFDVMDNLGMGDPTPDERRVIVEP